MGVSFYCCKLEKHAQAAPSLASAPETPSPKPAPKSNARKNLKSSAWGSQEGGTSDEKQLSEADQSKDSERTQSGRRSDSASEGGGSARKAFKQLQRVESKEEKDFAKQWDMTGRLISKLGVSEKDKNMMERRTNPGRESLRVAHGDGPRLDFPITFEGAEALRLHYIKNGASKPLHELAATQLIAEFSEKYKEVHPCSLSDVSLLGNGKPYKLIVVGDTHGQLQDVLYIFNMAGPPSASNVYLFNGDVADRGPNACEIYFLLFAYFLADPKSVIINRGNHESEEMNALEAEYGGGFRDEVFSKFDAKMYNRFVAMMKLLPLCTVINKEVFVVHGGLSDVEPVTLDFIRKIEHTECTMPEPSSEKPEDLVWNDFLWSDPVDTRGKEYSSRGVGILFGPDVTARFCQDNPPINLIVRSHQMPEDQRGYMKQYGGKCITIFSASNYCGTCGNQGGVLVFDSDTFPEFAPMEYYAPSLQMLSTLAAKGDKDWAAAGQALQEQEKKKTEDSCKEKEMQTMMVSIVENKPSIWKYIIDKFNGSQVVDRKTWVEVMNDVVGSAWRWDVALETWKLVDENGKVNMKEFLSRFSVVLSKDEYMAFKLRAITSVYESIIQACTSMESTLQMFDKDGDGSVDMHEMLDALGGIEINLTESQKNSLVHTLFKEAPEVNGLPTLPIKDFLSRFTVVYKRAEAALTPGGATDEQRWCQEAMTKIAQLIMLTPIASLSGVRVANKRKTRKLSTDCPGAKKKEEDVSPKARLKKAKSCSDEPVSPKAKLKRGSTAPDDSPTSPGGRSRKNTVGTASDRTRKDKSRKSTAAKGKQVAAKLEALFDTLDVDSSGSIDNEEFVNGMMALPGISDIKLSTGENLGMAQMRRLAKEVDQSGDGEISILELLDAFCFEDAGGEDMSESLAEHMLSVLFRHRQSLRAGARCFDPQCSGTVLRSEFHRVLIALNQVLADEGSGGTFLESQVGDLCDALSTEAERGREDEINYEDFFNSFVVVDRENPTLAVKLGRSSTK